LRAFLHQERKNGPKELLILNAGKNRIPEHPEKTADTANKVSNIGFAADFILTFYSLKIIIFINQGNAKQLDDGTQDALVSEENISRRK
jgi:hypothetical protein